MIEVSIPDRLIFQAENKASEMGCLRHSVTGGEGNLAGFLGELLVADYYNGVVENTYDYDVIINGRKVDVKTKRTTVRPQGHYFASVYALNTMQQCDSYYFVRIDVANKIGYLLGGLSKAAFFRKAVLYKKGMIDPTSHLDWKFTEDTYCVPVSELKL